MAKPTSPTPEADEALAEAIGLTEQMKALTDLRSIRNAERRPLLLVAYEGGYRPYERLAELVGVDRSTISAELARARQERDES